MDEEDEEKTSFVTDMGTFCYQKMPFGLKNAGATYQRLLNYVFDDQLGRNVEVYVNDIVVKSRSIEGHAKDLAETFAKLRKYNIKLNPDKCVFTVRSGKFLGHVVSEKGIEANPVKIEAIKEMKAPRSVKEVQKLNGCVTALGRFMSCSAKRCLPFFKTLKNTKNFQWNDECEKAFEELKVYLCTPPVLGKPEPGEILYLYLAVADETVAAVLVKEELGLQTPIYYTSKVLKGPEVRYAKIEKFALALKSAALKLRRYFEAHVIVVRTNQPLKKALHRPETSGRMASWSVQMSGFDIKYEARAALKAQVLADFVAETTTHDQPAEIDTELISWILEVDGASNLEGAGAGIVLKGPMGVELRSSVKFSFKASNNAAEYEALLAGLRLANIVKAEQVLIKSDSQLVVKQILGTFEAKDPEIRRYMDRAKYFLDRISDRGGKWEFEQVPRSQNEEADLLAKSAARGERLAGVHFSTLAQSSIDNPETIFLTQPLDEWMAGIARYLTEGSLPEDKRAAYKILCQAPRYAFLEGTLYRKSFLRPWSRCLTAEEGEYVLKEVYEGICGSHIAPRSLVKKVVLQGYYWPLMLKQAEDLVKKCNKCQQHQNLRHAPATEQSPIISPWPFSTWGIDILGPFPPATRKRKFLIVAIDHFTKWVEAEAVSDITSARVREFFWKEIVCRFGLPRVLIADNGKQFDCKKFKAFCARSEIDLRFTSVTHPQSNGMTEVTNQTILKGLKTRLDARKKKWVEELQNVLWAYRTTPREGTGETPFSLTYGCEAMVPVELGMPTLRVQFFNKATNEEEQRLSLDLLQERREKASAYIEAYKQRMAKYHNNRVKPQVFQLGDLVRRRADIGKGNAGVGKLEANWEGPYRVVQVGKGGAYHLASMSGKTIPRTWNSQVLRKYYQ
ncbi:uncharacterized protein LOC126672528 [Mercurialis annua]|uniref:uncharacterized protein LOC126672528 n=1 Tax=Mercurialis annua TaxID=3986 RepID=UPI00215F0E93|nr:uncharacterized protein LOC126672528 [Mercurialis annua]